MAFSHERRLAHSTDKVKNRAATNFNKKICCIGAGFVGGPTGAVIALNNPDVQVTVADVNQSRIDAWRSQDLPIHEPGLLDIVNRIRRRDDSHMPIGNLEFSTDVQAAIQDADLIFICVNTPTKSFGSGAGAAPDLSFVESAAIMIAEHAQSDKIVVQKSTVPVRTAEVLRGILYANARPGLEFELLSNPEFLAEGTAVRDLLYPDRVLIGSMPTPTGALAAEQLADLYATWVPVRNIIKTDVWSSELAKLTANAMLAQRISSINSLSAICESVGADVEEIAYIAGLDNRIGSKMLKPSVGFGGSCFQKDILSLCSLAEGLHLPEVATYWKGVLDINAWQKERFTQRLLLKMNNTLSMKTIAVLGFAYKKNTGDTRESPAIFTVKSLLTEGASVRIYDPQVLESTIWADLKDDRWSESDVRSRVTICDNAVAASTGAHAITILTDWDEFSNKVPPVQQKNQSVARIDSIHASPAVGTSTPESEEGPHAPVKLNLQHKGNDRGEADGIGPKRLDWSEVAAVMRRPAYVFDGRNVLDVAQLEALGFRVESVGKAGTAR